MAKLPTSLRVLREDILGSPTWAARAFQIYNTFNQALYQAMDGNITYTENIRCQIKEMTFTTEADYTSGGWVNIVFPTTIKVKPLETRIMQIYMPDDQDIPIMEGVTLDWIWVNGSVVVRFISGLDDSTKYFVRFMVS